MPDNPKIHEPKREGAFAWAEDIDADRECGYHRQLFRERCKACGRPVILHCDRCQIQVTGCLCTLIERMEPLEAYKMMAGQVGQTKAREMMQKFGYNMPLLPNIPM
jgi:hypothetical protein